MVMKTLKRADNNNDEIELVIEKLTHVIEKEIEAFQSLLNTLLEQQTSIVKGDTESVSLSNEKVERIVAETKALEKERRGESQVLSQCFNTDEELTITQLIPMVEHRYANRLEELKDMLLVLLEKIQNTNRHNSYLLEHSLRFLDNCLNFLIQDRENGLSYNKEGKIQMNETSLYKGVG